jgi:hypothetical protein
MKEKQFKFPGSDRPIAIDRDPARVVLIDGTQEEKVL